MFLSVLAFSTTVTATALLALMPLIAQLLIAVIAMEQVIS